MPRRLHRWLALALALPLILWTATGLLFHWKPGWDRAYDQLSVEQAEAPIDPGALRSAADVLAAFPAHRLELLQTAIGPLYRLQVAPGRGVLVEAAQGALLSPLSEARARRLVESAVEASLHRDAYGAITDSKSSDASFEFVHASGVVTTIGRYDAAIRQRGPDTERIDRLYRLHYVQWTGIDGVDRPLAVAVIVLTWLVTALGLALALRR